MTKSLRNRKELGRWARSILESDELCQMGHHQRREDANLGLGWLYYSLARIQRCATAVVVGSFRGFVPVIIARGLADNLECGKVVFVDPSFWDDHWMDAVHVKRYFRSLGVENVEHQLATTQQFIKTPEFQGLSEVGLLFLDGLHTSDQVRYEFSAFEKKMAPDGIVLLQNTMTLSPNTYGGLSDYYISDVTFFIDELKDRPDLQVFEFPRAGDPKVLSTGLALIRRRSTTGESAFYRDTRIPAYEALKEGARLFNQSKVKEALPLLTEAAHRNPRFPAVWLALGTGLVVAGDIGEGFRCLARAKELGHTRAEGLMQELKRALGVSGQGNHPLPENIAR